MQYNLLYQIHIMLTCFTYSLLNRCIFMALCSRNIAVFTYNIQTNARPFDEILCSFDTSIGSMPVKTDQDFLRPKSFDKCAT
ncbi:hypothetical protein I4U23_007368 [Adineta vaga]|nr:hypothetical protein I4U23_007368 [Adineta vaga]